MANPGKGAFEMGNTSKFVPVSFFLHLMALSTTLQPKAAVHKSKAKNLKNCNNFLRQASAFILGTRFGLE